MKGKMIDLIEDLDKGITIEQLAPKPTQKGDASNERANGIENETDRK